MTRTIKNISIILVLAAALTAASCNKEKTIPEPPALTISDTGFTVGDEGETITVDVTSNTSYTCEITDSEGKTPAWITKIESRASTTKSISFRVAANSEAADRTATIKFYAEKGRLDKRVVVKQLARTTEFSVLHTGGSFAVPLFTGVDVSGTVDWGDGEERDLAKETVHYYSSEDDEHCITFKTRYVESFKIESLEGVSLVDLSEM